MLECIKNRRSVRVFKDTPVPDDVLEKILDAGRWAPSGANSQPTEFIVVKNKESREKIRQLAFEAAEIEYDGRFEYMDTVMKDPAILREWFKASYNAPVMVVVATDNEKRDTWAYSSNVYYSMASNAACAAIMNIMLAARSFDLGSVWLTFPDKLKAKHYLGIPKTYEIQGFINLGYPVEWPKVTEEPKVCATVEVDLVSRRPLADMVHYEMFDEDKWQKYRPIFCYSGVKARDYWLAKLIAKQ